MVVTLAPFFVLPFLLFFNSAITTSSAELEPIHFTYSGSEGPTRWGSLNPHFRMCSTGKMQSPVNIVRSDAVVNKKLRPLNRDYSLVNATLVNNGFNIGIRYEGKCGALSLNGKNYTLRQMHWHSPSEHRIDGIQFKAELHLVHIANDGSISVVAILYHYGMADPLVSKIHNSLNQLANGMLHGHEETQIPVGTINVNHIRRNTRKYYRYVGSLTTPPCTHNVIWNILGKVRTISPEQVAELKAPLHMEYKNNCRPIQPLNGRHIELYDELMR